MAKHIIDIEKAYDLLREWCDVSSNLNNDGIVMAKEMGRLKIRTEQILSEN